MTSDDGTGPTGKRNFYFRYEFLINVGRFQFWFLLIGVAHKNRKCLERCLYLIQGGVSPFS